MDQFGLKLGGPSAATFLETMEDVVEGNEGGETKNENYRHHLPHHLHQSNEGRGTGTT